MRLSKKPIYAGISAATISAFCLFGILPAANAEAPESVANDTSALINEVAPVQGAVSATGSGVIPETGEVVATSEKAGVASEVHDAAGNLKLSVPLPSGTDATAPVQAADGTDVYSADGSVDVAVQVMDDGATRVQAILKDSEAASSQRYEIPEGYTGAIADDGSVVLSGEEGLVHLETPWARDANGRSIQTSYRIDGSAVIQDVNLTSETVYPVVADPVWKWYYGAYGTKWSKAETRSIASYGAAAGACVAITKKMGGIACGLYGAYLFLRAQQVANAKGCMFIALVPAPLVLNYYGSDCK